MPLLMLLVFATGSSSPKELAAGRSPVGWVPAAVRSTAQDLDRLYTGAEAAVGLPTEPHGRTVHGFSTEAGAGAGHKPGVGIGQVPMAASGAPKVKTGASAKVYVGYDAKTSRMDQKRTDATQTWYDNADGSLTERVYQTPQNFRNAAGQWQTINPALVRGASGWHNAAAGFSVTLASSSVAPAATSRVRPHVSSDDASADPDGTVSLDLGTGQDISWSILGAADVAGTPSADGNTVTYPGILADTDLEVTSEDYGVKETFALQSASAPHSFTFPLSMTGLSLSQDAQGDWDLVAASGNVVADLLAPYAVDSAVSQSGGGAQTNDVAYSLATVDGVEQLTMSVPDAWLNDPARVYPVYVDPTISINGETETSYVSNEYPTQNYASDQELKIGYDSGTPQTARSFLNFPNSIIVSGNGYHFSSMQFTAFKLWDGGSSDSFTVRAVAGTWSPTTVDWNNQPSYYGTTAGTWTNGTTGSSATVTADGTSFTGIWTTTDLNLTLFDSFEENTTSAFHGIEIVAASETTADGYEYWKKFASSQLSGYSPYLSYNYTPDVPPTITQQAPQSGSSINTLTPNLSVQATDSDMFPNVSALQYQFYVYNVSGGTAVAQSSSQSASSWTVPAGKLSWQKTYQWVVCVFDGAECATGNYSFTTTAPPPILGGTLSSDTNGHGYNAATGDYTTSTTDAQVASVGPSPQVDRSYNSFDGSASGGFGAGWSTETDASVAQILTPAGSISEAVVTYPDGEQVTFAVDSDGTYVPPEGRYATLTCSPTAGYTLVDKSGSTYVFGQVVTAGRISSTNSAAACSGAEITAGVWGISSVADHAGHTLDYDWGPASTATGAPTVVTQEENLVSRRFLYLTWVKPSGAASWHISTVATDPADAGYPDSAQLWTYQYTGDELTGACAPVQLTTAQLEASSTAAAASSTACAQYAYGETGSLYQQAVLNAGAQQYWPLSGAASDTADSTLALADYGTGALANTGVGLGSIASSLAGSTATAAAFTSSGSQAVDTSTVVDTRGDFTVSAWADLASKSGFQDILSEDSTKNSGFELQFDSTSGTFAFARALTDATGATVNRAVGATAPATGTWYFLTGTYIASSGLMTLYVNGTKDGSTATDTTPYAATGDFVVGRGQSGATADDRFDGDISDVATFTEALTASQISQLYGFGTHAQTWLTKIQRPDAQDSAYSAGQQPAAQIAYDPADGRVTSVTDANGGSWSISSPAGSLSPAVYQEAVTAGAPQHYWPLGDGESTGVVKDEVDHDTLVDPSLSQAEYNSVNLGVTGTSEFTGLTGGQFVPSQDSYVQLPSKQLDMMQTGTIVLWFNTTTKGGVLLGTSADAVSAGTTPGAYTPMVYIGNDGLLYASFYAYGGHQITSGSEMVADGHWHMIVLTEGSAATTAPPVATCPSGVAQVPPTATPTGVGVVIAPSCPSPSPSASASSPAPTTQSMYLDGTLIGSSDPTLFTTPNQVDAFLGAGFIGGGWPHEANQSSTSNTGTVQYFNGDISDVALYQSALGDSDVSNMWDAYKNAVGGGYAPLAQVSVTDPTATYGTQTPEVFDYDPGNGMREVRYTDPLNQTTQYGYDASGYLDTTTDASGNEAIQGHDARGNVVSQTLCQNQAANECSTSYSTYYLDPGFVTDPRNDMVATSSDGRSAAATDPTYETTYAYDLDGNQIQKVAPGGLTSTSTYTQSSTDSCVSGSLAPADLLASTTTPGGAVTSYTYYPDGDTCTALNAVGQITYFTYNGLGQVASKTVGHQLVGVWSGRHVVVVGPELVVRVQDQSGLGNDLGAVDVVRSGNDLEFNGTTSELEANNPVALGSASASFEAWIDPATYAQDEPALSLGPSTVLGYAQSADDWQFSTTVGPLIPVGHRTTYTAHSSGSASAAGTGVWTQLVGVYDSAAATISLYVNGSLAGTVAAPRGGLAGGQLTMGDGFDGLITDVQAYQRALSADEVSDLYSEGSAGAPVAGPPTDDQSTTYTYYGNGLPESVTNPATTDAVTGDVHTLSTASTYDDDANLLSSTESDLTGDDAARTVSYVYNGHDQKISDTSPEGNVPADPDDPETTENHTTGYTYDLYGQVETETDPRGVTTEFLYDADEHKGEELVEDTSESGTASPGNTLVSEKWVYDANGRLAQDIQDPNDLDYTTEYSYYDNGDVFQVTQTDGTHTSIASTSYYDGAGEVIEQVTNNGVTVTETDYDADDPVGLFVRQPARARAG
jgi:large repetitive protein